jgi:hypothetical protein
VSDNPLQRTIDQMNEGLARFYWDALTALTVNHVSGDYAEFGSWGCNTLRHAYHACLQWGGERHLWAFDSFRGLPPSDDARDTYRTGAWSDASQGGAENFYKACDGYGVPRDAYTAIEGYFKDTLPAIGPSGEPRDIALAYIDCNLYSSTVTAFEFLEPRQKPGMIIGFDDYYLYDPETGVSGEREALREFLTDHPEWHFQRFKDIHWSGVAFVVEHSDAGFPRRPS